MTIVRVGATKKYSDGWESAFGRTKKQAAAPAGKTKAKAPAKKTAAKKVALASAKKKSGAKKTKR